MKDWKPLFVKADRFLSFLSVFAPITITAITLGVLVLYSGELSERTRRHETIHFQQYLETLFVGFLIIYLYDWLKGVIIYGSGRKAYIQIRAEQEAYGNDADPDYLRMRLRWVWLSNRV